MREKILINNSWSMRSFLRFGCKHIIFIKCSMLMCIWVFGFMLIHGRVELVYSKLIDRLDVRVLR